MFKTTRRGFMIGCSAAIASMASGVRFTAFGNAADEPNQNILIVIFLRGGMDGISAVFPIAGDDRGYYEQKRSRLAVPTSGTNKALDLDGFFGLNPGAAALHELYQAKKFAIVHAAGLTSDTRSHFDAMQYMEMGTPGSKSSTSGWLARHLQTAGNLPSDIVMPAVSVGNLSPTSLAGSPDAIGMNSPGDLSFIQHWKYGDSQRQTLRQIYTNSGGWLGQAAIQTLDAVDVIEYADPGNYTPGNSAVYPNSGLANNMKSIAQLIKMQLGLRVATVDFGGWDTHESQGDGGAGYFSGHLGELSNCLSAFYTDMSNDNGTDHNQRITVAVMSEFGRSFAENGSAGTDHGHGNIMMLLGGQVNGGKVYGQWPGLHTDQLYEHRDLEITTDYRRVLSEILIRRHGNANLGTIFPGYTDYQPLGVVTGVDLTPNYTTTTTPPNGTIPNNPALTEKVFLPVVTK